MKHICKISIVLFLLIGKAVCQDFSFELKLENNPPKLYRLEYRSHTNNDPKDLQKFDYKTDPNRNIEFVQYYFGRYDVKNEILIDTINAAIYSSKTSESTVIIDANKDFSFRNDREYVFNKSTPFHEVNLPVQIDKYSEGHIDTKSYLITRVEESVGKTKTEKFKIIKNWIYKGSFKLNNLDGEFYSELQVRMFMYDFKLGEHVSPFNRIGDTVLIGDKLFSTRLDRSRVYFTDIGKIDYNLLPATEYVTKKELNKDDLKGKYLLYDFWGSWCQPCIKGIPDLKALKEKYSPNLEVVSIAYENSSDLTELDKLIKEQKMDWPQLYYLKKDKDPKKNSSRYYIKVFPTFVLIDPQGKVVTRVENIHRLKEIADILQKKFN